MSTTQVTSCSESSAEYVRQSEKLSLASESTSGSTAVEAKFITPLDPVIQTADGNRLPAVPVDEAHKINTLKHQAENSLSDFGERVVEELPAPERNNPGEQFAVGEHAEFIVTSKQARWVWQPFHHQGRILCFHHCPCTVHPLCYANCSAGPSALHHFSSLLFF
jgi:hypothetical protein